MFKLSLALGISLVLFLIPLNVEARKNIEDIGIQLDRTCIALIKAEMKTNCPTYEEILLIYPDTSNKRISGDFVFKDGMLQRQTSHLKNHIDAYKYEQPITWIDPPGDIRDKIKTITITSKLSLYKVSESKQKKDNTLVFGIGRYVDTRCHHAIITANNWQFLLNDTIQYLQSDCQTTNFNSIKKIYQKPTDHDIKSSKWYQYQEWLKAAKLQSKDKFLINQNKSIYSPEAR